MTQLIAVRLGARAQAWSALGFEAAGGALGLANGSLVFDQAAPSGIAGLVVTGDRLDQPADVDGLPFEWGPASSAPGHRSAEIDHVVVMTNSLERTSAAIETGLGLECRRIRDTGQVRQAFHRFDDPPGATARGCILEIVEHSGLSGAGFWGLVITVDDLDALCETNPDLISPPKAAVQPKRRIATARREAELGTAVAFMSR